jgi:hypothetical protein
MSQRGGELLFIKATIQAGGSLSAAVDLTGLVICGIVYPSTWDDTGGGSEVTFQVGCPVNGVIVYSDWYEGNPPSEVTLAVAKGKQVKLLPADFAGVSSFKIRSGTQAAPYDQAAEQDIYLAAKPI